MQRGHELLGRLWGRDEARRPYSSGGRVAAAGNLSPISAERPIFRPMAVGGEAAGADTGDPKGGRRLCVMAMGGGVMGGGVGALLRVALVLMLWLAVLPGTLAPGVARALAVLLIFLAGLVGALLPWWLRSSPAADKWMGRGNALSAGVMFGAGMIHLLGDAVEMLTPPPPCDPGLHSCGGRLIKPMQCPASKRGVEAAAVYPLALLLSTAGFMLTFVMEELGFWLLHRIPESVESDDFASDAVFDEGAVTSGMTKAGSGHAQGVQQLQTGSQDIRTGSSLPTKVMLTVALSFHSVMEGMALGAVPTEDVLEILLTILAHKSLAAFALGSSLLRGQEEPSRLWFVGVASCFALASPLGSLLAVLVDTETPFFAPVVLSLSSGTFVYVALMELLAKRQSTRSSTEGAEQLVQLSCVLGGWVAMALLALCDGDGGMCAVQTNR
jgi:zinc transporter ZupT